MKFSLLLLLLLSLTVGSEELCVDCINTDVTNGSFKNADELARLATKLQIKASKVRSPASYDDVGETTFWKVRGDFRVMSRALIEDIRDIELDIRMGKRSDIKVPTDLPEIASRYEFLRRMSSSLKNWLHDGLSLSNGTNFKALLKQFKGTPKYEIYENMQAILDLDWNFFDMNFRYLNNFAVSMNDQKVNKLKSGAISVAEEGKGQKEVLDALLYVEKNYDPKSIWDNITLAVGYSGGKNESGISLPKGKRDYKKGTEYGYRAAKLGSTDVVSLLLFGYKYVEPSNETFDMFMVTLMNGSKIAKKQLTSKQEKLGEKTFVQHNFEGKNIKNWDIYVKNNFFQNIADEYEFKYQKPWLD